VRAIAGGVVRLVREFNIHGNTVGIDHGQGLSSIYLHLSKFAVAEGDAVTKGEVIGYIGSTGRSTGPHLHWSLYANGVPVNPARWVAHQVLLRESEIEREEAVKEGIARLRAS
jgi:murein DD-endopeptidase MepM/ murein hydrolase activator NlpD